MGRTPSPSSSPSKAVTAKTIQQLDKLAIEQYGVPSLALMELAGKKVAELTQYILRNKSGAHVCIVCGIGNNGGDGFVCARHLLNTGLNVKIFVIGDVPKLKEDAATNYKILKKLKYPIEELRSASESFIRSLKESDVVIDAIFGVGLSRLVLDPYKAVIEAIDEHAAHVVSVDVPSGLNATTGEILNVCVRAKHTVTFTLPKKGFYIKEGPKHTGKIVIEDIGIPLKLLKKLNR